MDDNDKFVYANLISSSLLTAIYSYLSWKHPMDFDEETYAKASKMILDQHFALLQVMLDKLK